MLELMSSLLMTYPQRTFKPAEGVFSPFLGYRPLLTDALFSFHSHYSAPSTCSSSGTLPRASLSSVCVSEYWPLGFYPPCALPPVLSLCMPFLYLGSTWSHWTHTCKSLTKRKKGSSKKERGGKEKSLKSRILYLSRYSSQFCACLSLRR